MKTSAPDHLIAIVLAARDHFVALDAAPARAVVEAIDVWATRGLAPEQLSGIERDHTRAAVDATTRERALGDHLLGTAEWTSESLSVARNAARVSVCIYNAGAALAAAARMASAGEHARHVSARAMHAVEYTTRALVDGAAVRRGAPASSGGLNDCSRRRSMTACESNEPLEYVRSDVGPTLSRAGFRR